MNPLDKIQQQGRLTEQKKQILKALDFQPQTIAAIQTRLVRQKARLNLVTIYRVLKNFTALGITRQVRLQDGVNRYELGATGHHHHLVCENCGVIADIKLNQESFIHAAERQGRFKIHHHLLEFFGLCRHCQRKK